MNTVRSLARIAVLSSLGTLAACQVAAGDIDDELEGASAPTRAPIVGGTTASAYPEAALVDMMSSGSSYFDYMCSGSLIAPRVILTAGHCVSNIVKWRVTLPFAGNQTATATSGATYDWDGASGDMVDPNKHDLGLVFLSTPLTLSQWPVVASAPIAFGSNVVNIGRIKDGVASSSALYVGAPVAAQNGANVGFPYDYSSSEIIQSGDSGGPDEVPGSSPHKIVSVNSGGGSGTQVLARVDLVYSWLDSQVKAHGGWASSTAPAPTPSPTPTPTTSCTAKEAESNDSYTTPNPLPTGTECGALTAGDQDWFTWSVGSTATTYDVKLVASGDAQIQMWKNVSGSYYQVSNTSPTDIAKTSNGAGSYVVVVWSPSGAAQSYTLTLKR